jgi:lipopolysaccharide/colanic/teichoic acid biosynthesis glycosyltransferase
MLIVVPVSLAVAAAIVLDSPGPVLYRAPRVGRGGRRFDMLKFRKMPVGAGGRPLTLPDDERFTRVGGFLARTKLDELPQLWNVVRGRMSIVGPRPEDPSLVAAAPEAFAQTLRLRPGITGFAQLEFAREGELLDRRDPVGSYLTRILPRKLALDALYARRASVWTDLRVLWFTAVAVLGHNDVVIDRSTGKPRRG